MTVPTDSSPVTFQLASDLHLEWLQPNWPGERLIEPVPGADALLLAGDIANMTQVADLFADWPVPVFMVPGNHEYYGLDIAKEREAIAAGAYNKGSLTVLDDTEVVFKGVRILGSTLWTDYRLFAHLTLPEAFAVAQAALSGADHSRIQIAGKRFLPEHACALHQVSRSWVKGRLSQSFDGPTLVMTHHAPSIQSVSSRWRSEESSVCFASNVPEVSQADFWVHGHLHENADYEAGRCRVLANPRGYGRGAAFAKVATDMEFENHGFSYDKTFQVPTGRVWRRYAATRPSYVQPTWSVRDVEMPEFELARWAVTDGARSFESISKEDAFWLAKTLNALERRGLGEDDESDLL